MVLIGDNRIIMRKKLTKVHFQANDWPQSHTVELPGVYVSFWASLVTQW